jgi:hypothetical protein
MAEITPSIAIIYALVVVTAYSYYKNMKEGMMSIGSSIGFFTLLIIGELMINIGMSKDICGFEQYKSALIATILPWFLVFGVLKAVLSAFPGWLIPFGNTFGYLFVSIVTDMKEVFDNILTPQFNLDPSAQVGKDEPSNSVANKKDIGKALEQIYTDKSILLNELNLDNIEDFWRGFKESKLIRESAKYEELGKLKHFIMMKSIVSEFVWYVLAVLLVVSISYNYLLNSRCVYTPEQQRIRAKALKEKKDAMDAKKNKEKNTIYTVTA